MSIITVSVAEFAQKLREKYPQHASLPDDKLIPAYAQINPKFRVNYRDSIPVSVSWEYAAPEPAAKVESASVAPATVPSPLPTPATAPDAALALSQPEKGDTDFKNALPPGATIACPACGTKITKESKFCPDCGASQMRMAEAPEGEKEEKRIHDLALALTSAIKTIEPIWEDACLLCSLTSEGKSFEGSSFADIVALDFLNAVADIGEAVGNTSLTGKAYPAAQLAFTLLEQAAPETLFPPEDAITETYSFAERRAWKAAFVAGCKEVRRKEPRSKFWEPLSVIGLEAYDALQSTSYGLLSAKVFLQYFRELKRLPELARIPLLDSTISRLEEFISTEQESTSVSRSAPSLGEPETAQIVTPSAESAMPSHASHYTVGSYQGAESPLWRYMKVGLRTVWRISKIVAVSAFCLLIAAIILLQVFMFLYEHWNNESKHGRGAGSGGLQTEKFFAFLNGITWLPQQMWQGLVLIVTILFLALVFAGKWIGEQVLANMTLSVALASIGAVSLLVWVFVKERKAEFEPSETNPQPTTMSWVMGLVVLIAAAGASVWWIQDGRARFVQGYTLNHAQVTTEGANVASPRPNPQSIVESTPSAAAVPLKASRCNAEAEEQNVPLWNGYSLRLSPMKSQPDSGCMAVVMGEGEEEAWRKGSAAFEVVPVTGQDINGDGVPELVLEAFSGGAHCCWTYYILTLTPTPRVVSLENEGPARFEPDPIGGYVMVTGDGSFAYFDGSSNAESPYPDVFFQLERSSFRNVSGNHWPTFQRKIDSARQRLTPESLAKFKASDGQHFDVSYNHEFRATKSAILGIVLEYLYGGRPQQAWREFESMWPESDRNRMRQLIEDTRAKGILGKTPAVRAGLRGENRLTEQPTPGAKVKLPPLLARLVEAPAAMPSSPTTQNSRRDVIPGLPYRVGNGVTAPKVVHRVEPLFTEESRKKKLGGVVILKVVIGADGIPHDVTVRKSLGTGLDENAVEAVRQWRFQPGSKDGQPVPVEVNIEVTFHFY